MVSITIRNVPQDVHDVFVARARKAGMSLQDYMLRWLEELPERNRVEELLDQLGRETKA